jgi:hypothetical protein
LILAGLTLGESNYLKKIDFEGCKYRYRFGLDTRVVYCRQR